MKIKYLTILALLILSIVGVSATADITYNAANVQSFSALAFDCTNADCSQVTDFSGSLPASTNNGQLTVEFPTSLASQNGYALFFTSPGYFPQVYLADWAGNGATSDSFTFTRGDICSAKISEFSVVNEVVENVPLTIVTEASLDASTEGAFALTNHPVKYLPPSLKEYYTSDVKVTLLIRDSQGNTVKQQSTIVKAMAGQKAPVEFSWTPQNSGEYVISLTTEVVDDQCESSQEQGTSKMVTVLEEGPRNICYTLVNGLTTNVNEGRLDWSLNTESYHANDYVFVDTNYKLTQVPTSLSINVLNFEGQPYAVHSESLTVPVGQTASGSADLTPGFYLLEVQGLPNNELCTGLTSQSETATVSFTIAAPQTYSVEFHLVDPSGTGVKDATVVLGGASKTTDNSGRVVFNDVVSGTYDYSISKEGFKNVNAELQVTDSNKDISLTLDFTEPVENPQPPADVVYDVTFTVLDKSTGMPVEGVTIVIEGAAGSTGSNGKLTFQGLSNGAHTYSLTHSEYEARSSRVNIAGGDVSLTLLLERVTGSSTTNEEPKTPKVHVSQRQRQLAVNSVRMPGAFEVKAGEEILLVVNTANNGEADLNNIRVSAVIQELGVRGTSQSVKDLDNGDKLTQRLVLKMPENTPKGVHYVRIAVDSDHAHRVLYREIEVV